MGTSWWHCGAWVDAAIRETQEETNLFIKDLRLLSIDDKIAIYISDDWRGEIRLDHEHDDWAWIGRADLSTYDTVPLIKDLYELAIMYGERKKRN